MHFFCSRKVPSQGKNNGSVKRTEANIRRANLITILDIVSRLSRRICHFDGEQLGDVVGSSECCPGVNHHEKTGGVRCDFDISIFTVHA